MAGKRLGMSPFMYDSVYTPLALPLRMRRMTVELVPDPKWFALMGDLKVQLDVIESVTILDVLKLDFEKGVKTVVAEVLLREDVPIESVYPHEIMEVVAQLKREGRKHTIIARMQVPAKWLRVMRKLDLDLIWDVPILKSPKRIVTTAVGDERELKRFLDVLSEFGKVKDVSFQAVSVRERGLLGNLTRKQREVLLAAKREGYYDYPRRVRTEDLARKMGVKKSTLIEHLRRAENRLIQEVLAKY